MSNVTTEAVHVDFFNMPPTNEQQILATLLRIEALLQQQAALTPKSAQVPEEPKKPSRAEQIAALQPKGAFRRK